MKKSIVIYPHNKRAYEKVCAAFEVSNKTCVIHPTGTGKMYVALQLIDANADKAILYLTSYSPILTALETEMEKCDVAADNLTMGLYASLDEAAVECRYDYIILDEFHRAGAEVWGSWISKLLENNPQAKILGLSATPIRYLDNNRDMSDELFDGNIASSMTLAEAIGTGILKVPKYVCAVYSLSEEFSRYEERVNKMNTGTDKTEALALLEKARRSLERSDGLHEIFGKHIPVKNGRYIVFCRNYEHMESMKTECHFWLHGVNRKIELYEVRADRPESINRQVLADFSADNSEKLKLLFAVDMLNEGIHICNVDGCIMMRPTESMNVYLQQLGRAISVSNNAQAAVFDIVNNSLQLNAMGSFKSDVERAAFQSGKEIDLEDFVIHESLQDFCNIISQLDILLTNKSWDEWFSLVKEHYDLYGSLFAGPRYAAPEAPALKIWLNRQRICYHQGTLSAERIAKLNAVGMIWDILNSAWEQMYDCAQKYFDANGDLLVPNKYVTPEGLHLGAWINTQRVAYKRGSLSTDRTAKLNALQIVWDPLNAAWEVMFAHAKEYFELNGDLRIPRSYLTSEGVKLGTWCGTQRERYKKGKLSNARIAKLEAVGMEWTVPLGPKRSPHIKR